MKIICTEAEKRDLVKILADNQLCPFDSTTSFRCNYGNCETCVELNVEWELVDES